MSDPDVHVGLDVLDQKSVPPASVVVAASLVVTVEVRGLIVNVLDDPMNGRKDVLSICIVVGSPGEVIGVLQLAGVGIAVVGVLGAVPHLAFLEWHVDEILGLGHGCENCHHEDGREDCGKFPFH